MKKFIGIILAMTISFTLIPNVFAYSDVSNREDITVLSDLGIIDGFEDGTFRVDEPLTRAQLVKIICVLMGYNDVAQGAVSYSDVPASHWASGYINQADALKIIAGFEDGTFHPDEKVSYEQAVKMVVCALGYEPAAQTVGSGNWYNGYLNIASSIGITKGVKGSVGMSFTRGNMAKLIYNALSTQMMDVKSWGGNGIEYATSEDTILSKYLEIEKWEGVVTSTPYMGYMAGTNVSIGEIDLADAAMYQYDGKKITTDPFTAAKCDKDVEDLLGKKVVCYVGEDVKGDWRVFSIAEKDSYNSTLTIKASDIEKADTDYIYYTNDNDKTAKAKLSKNITYVCNFAETTTFDYTDVNGYLTLISNDNNNEYDYAIYYTYDIVGSVVKDIEVYDEIISFDADGIDEYDAEDDNVTIVVIKDGAVASIEDITVDDVISVVGDGDFMIYFVSSKNVSGKVTGIDISENIIRIGENEYSYAASFNADRFVMSDYITAYFNVDDEIVDIDTDDVTLNKYVMLLRYRYDSSDDEAKIDVLTTDGKKETYVVDEKKTSDVNAEINAYLDDTTGRLLYTCLDYSIYSIKVRSKDNQLTSIKAATTDVSNWITGKTYDEETLTFGPIDLSTLTVMFSVEAPAAGINYIKAENVTVGKATEFFTDDEGEDFSIKPFVVRDEVYSILVGKDITGTISSKNEAMIIESVVTSHIEEEDEIGYVITGIQGGKEVEYSLIDCAEPKKGDVILLGAKNSNGVIDKYEPLTSVDDVKATAIGGTNKVQYYQGEVDRANTDGTRIYFENGTNLLLKSSANYTLVDCTGSRIEVSKKTKGISIFGSADKYESYAYVRYYDDVQTEVIVYRFNKTN